MSIPSVDRTLPRHYGHDGSRFFSVSQICRVMTGEDSYGSEMDVQRGTDLHTIFALSVASYAGHCAPPIVPQDYQGYYQSMSWWIARWKPEPVLIERPAVSAMKGRPFAGTPDLLAWTHGNEKRMLSLIDLKSGQKAPWHRVQVQAYQRLLGYQEATALRLLYIHADGSEPDSRSVKRNPRELAAFLSAINLLIYRETP